MKHRFNIYRLGGESKVADTACLLASRWNGLGTEMDMPVLHKNIEMEYPKESREIITAVGECDLHIDLDGEAVAHIKLVEVAECPEAEQLTPSQARLFIQQNPEVGAKDIFKQNPKFN